MDSIFFYRNPKNATSGNGPLQDLRIAIQPNISVAGWPTEAGSKALAGFVAVENSTIAQRLSQAEASLVGSTRMSEFGFGLDGSHAGDVINEQAADAELVIDLMGESRLAALKAGVCGFKPSYGLVSRYGLVGLIPSMECCGIVSRNLKIIRKILEVVAGRDELDFSLPNEKFPDFSTPRIDPKNITIGVVSEAQSDLNSEQSAMFLTSIDEIKKSGFSIREISFPDFSLFSLVHKIVGSVEASSCAGRYDSVRYGPRIPGAKNWNDMYRTSRGAAFGPLIKSYLFQGAFFQFERYKAFEDACRIRARMLANMQRLTAQADFLIFPAVNRAASEALALLGDAYAQFASTIFANITGQPALYLAPFSGQSGFQLAGPRLSDARLLALGEFLLATRQGGN